MKRTIFALITIFFLSSANAQMEDEQTVPQTESQKLETPKWVSDKGYWVVESNKKTPKDAIIYFYNNENVLVYKEEIKNRKLKLNRNKTLLQLKAALEEAVNIHEAGTWAANTKIIERHLQ